MPAFVLHMLGGTERKVEATSLRDACAKTGVLQNLGELHDLIAYDRDGVQHEIAGTTQDPWCRCVNYAEEGRSCDHDLRDVGLLEPTESFAGSSR